ncbi:MAG TPA: hypothetical protein VGS97_05290 [Actinocrinis sp.]|uniref:hypothetical protein n=1 Tax=Actinocrinis sp. TaxID=1920516 RepID=UPI002DDD7CB4|nr:hypothetical protein [Actinocrinis sp.]HEV2343488.1 hypothetical protein [Actinocrinis sp.]
MGIMPTYCQICGLPVNFDHYLPQDDGTLYIWRGDEGEGGDEDEDKAREPAIAFGSQHAWLRRAVGLDFGDGPAVEPPMEGEVHSGYLEPDDEQREGQYVMDGAFDVAAVHRACWVLAGHPDSFKPLEHLQLPEAEEPYRGQLFEFAAFVADGHGWMLVDPDEDSPDGRHSRQRIIALLS